ncbi:MAG: 3-polyprenyl-4-hydroxybenzoate decarboxylase-like protein [Planctomycetaceae bacterium]|nr:3-polyprenyl-4-hydroxybenzoate decarboxylase-like protein [Planctomycetaceae bacterium]
MGYRNLQQCVRDLEHTRQLVRIEKEIDPYLEAAEIQRRVYLVGGPAVLFARVKGSPFPMVSNLFGTLERTRYLFRDALEAVRHLVELKIDPNHFWKNPWRYRDVPSTLWHMWLGKVSRGPSVECQCRIQDLPQVVSWPRDAGAFVTLPQVYSEDVDHPGLGKSNLGMYRVQLSGGQYVPDRQVGLHYQIHRGIGVHHAAAIRKGVPFRVNIFVGGPPAMTLAAVMPLPEGLSELLFAGALGGRAIRMVCRPGQLPIPAESDFCISGTVDPQQLLPEGPFGDHLGYYSLAHDFPVLNVDHVYHRKDAIWPFTTVGRPPQEDTSFGEIIHEITGPIIPSVIPGVRAIHAVDAAGVHPLLLAIGSERYVPYARKRVPQELLTQANAILGQGQLSLAKYLLIAAGEDAPQLEIHEIPAFLRHLLERVDWERDLHFQTRTTIDTLDYSGSGLNQGSKVVVAVAGEKRRELPTEIPGDLRLPDGFHSPRICLPGILAVQAPPFDPHDETTATSFTTKFTHDHAISKFPLIVLVDDSEFTARTLNNFLWVTFTRSNPAADLYGIAEFTHQKHWGCQGSLVIDARIKPHHAPPLVEDPEVTRRVDALAAPGGPLHGVI